MVFFALASPGICAWPLVLSQVGLSVAEALLTAPKGNFFTLALLCYSLDTHTGSGKLYLDPRLPWSVTVGAG